MFDSVAPEEIDFLRLMLKCDANLSQEKKHLKTKLARTDFTEYVENIARLRLMLDGLESDPKRNKTDADLVEYRNRLNYLDKTLTDLEVESMPAPMELVPPPVDPAFAGTKDADAAMAGGCIFKKAAAAPAAEAPAAGGCIFKKASSAPSAAPAGVCPMSGASKKPQEGSCPVSGKGKSVDDMFKDAENMSGCPMFEASPEEAEKMRQEAAGDLDAPKQDSQGKCPMTGAPGQATGCPMAQPGDHPELDGTWMAPVSDDPDACPTFLPRPILDPPKYSGVKTKKMKADDGLVILEEAENEVRATFDFTLEKIRMGEAEQLADNVQTKALEDASKKPQVKNVPEQIQEWPIHALQSFLTSHISQIWMASAMLVFAYMVAKLTL